MASETPPEKERTKGRKQIVKTNDGQVKHTSSNSRENEREASIRQEKRRGFICLLLLGMMQW